MAKSDFKKLGTTDSILAAHINGLSNGLNNLENIIDLEIAAKVNYPLSAIKDQSDINIQYRIYECDIKNWVKTPAPKIKKNGVLVTEAAYVLYAGYGAIVFHLQQDPGDIITADFTHLTEVSGLKKKVDKALQDIIALQLKPDIEPVVAGVKIPYPIHPKGAYVNAAQFGNASYRGPGNTGGTKQAANDLLVLPIVISKAHTYNRMATNVFTSGGGNIRFGVWKDDEGYPGALVHGSTSAGGAGLKWKTETFDLEEGVYWVGFHSDADQNTQGVSSEGLPALGTAWNGDTHIGYIGSVVFGAGLPDPFPSGLGKVVASTNKFLPAVFIGWGVS